MMVQQGEGWPKPRKRWDVPVHLSVARDGVTAWMGLVDVEGRPTRYIEFTMPVGTTEGEAIDALEAHIRAETFA